MNYDDAKAAFEAAEKAWTDFEQRRNRKLDAARDAIKAEYATEEKYVSAAYSEARAAFDAAKIAATKAHPFLGKKLRRNTAYVHQEPKWLYGIAEVYDGTNEVSGLSYYTRRSLERGYMLVRLLKKDGTPGKKVEVIHTWELKDDAPERHHSRWQVCP